MWSRLSNSQWGLPAPGGFLGDPTPPVRVAPRCAVRCGVVYPRRQHTVCAGAARADAVRAPGADRVRQRTNHWNITSGICLRSRHGSAHGSWEQWPPSAAKGDTAPSRAVIRVGPEAGSHARSSFAFRSTRSHANCPGDHATPDVSAMAAYVPPGYRDSSDHTNDHASQLSAAVGEYPDIRLARKVVFLS